MSIFLLWLALGSASAVLLVTVLAWYVHHAGTLVTWDSPPPVLLDWTQVL